MNQGKVISRATRTTSNADGTRKVVTVIQFADGTRKESIETLPPRNTMPEPQPVIQSGAQPVEDASFDNGTKSEHDEDDSYCSMERDKSYISIAPSSADPGPLSMVIVDEDEDVSVMESLYEHPVLNDIESQPVISSKQDETAPNPTLLAKTGTMEYTNPSEKGASYENHKSNVSRNRWLLVGILLICAGAVLGVVLGFKAYKSSLAVASPTSSSVVATSQENAQNPIVSERPSSGPAALSTSPRPTSPAGATPPPSPIILEATQDPTTSAPVLDPTLGPTQVASLSTTIKQSPSPSFQATQSITSQPTISTSVAATLQPTEVPFITTQSPTSRQTISPSVAATFQPTEIPIISTQSPTLQLTLSPSVAATLQPTEFPVFSTAPVASSAAPISTEAPFGSPVAQVGSSCKDSIGWVDQDNEGCSYYELNGCFLNILSANNAGVAARRACCACGGGDMDFVDGDAAVCRDYFGFVDEAGDSCDWYILNNSCNLASLYGNSVGVSAAEACCGCGGGSIPMKL